MCEFVKIVAFSETRIRDRKPFFSLHPPIIIKQLLSKDWSPNFRIRPHQFDDNVEIFRVFGKLYQGLNETQCNTITDDLNKFFMNLFEEPNSPTVNDWTNSYRKCIEKYDSGTLGERFKRKTTRSTTEERLPEKKKVKKDIDFSTKEDVRLRILNMKQNMSRILEDARYVVETIPKLIESTENNYETESKINEQYDSTLQKLRQKPKRKRFNTTTKQPNWNEVLPFPNDDKIDEFFNENSANKKLLANHLISMNTGKEFISDSIRVVLCTKYLEEHVWAKSSKSELPLVHNLLKSFLLQIFNNDKEIAKMNPDEKTEKIRRMFNNQRYYKINFQEENNDNE